MKAESESHAFLVFRYPGLNFFINRNSVETSLFREPGLDAPESGWGKGFSADIRFEEKTLISYDLSRFLKRLVPESPKGEEARERRGGVALILPVREFSPGDRRAIEEMVVKFDISGVSQNRVALTLGRHGEAESIPLREIRLFSPGLRRPLRHRGILGCRFALEGECQWFLDAGRIWMNAFKKAADKFDLKMEDR